jgi:hypothetical protein
MYEVPLFLTSDLILLWLDGTTQLEDKFCPISPPLGVDSKQYFWHDKSTSILRDSHLEEVSITLWAIPNLDPFQLGVVFKTPSLDLIRLGAIFTTLIITFLLE